MPRPEDFGIKPPAVRPPAPPPPPRRRDNQTNGGGERIELRDYFAAKAMQGMVGSIRSEDDYSRMVELAHLNGLERVSDWIARDAYKQADAMLRARQ